MAFPVAVIQPTIEAGDIEQNRQTVARAVADAASKGAKLILLPEGCISDLFRGAEKLAETVPGPSTELLMRVAGSATVALPLLEKSADGKVYSSCALVNSNGVSGIARKTHLYRDASGHDSFRDAEILTAGTELGLFDLGEIRVGIVLGFDGEFPEIFRTLALRGADLICVAQNCLEPDRHFLTAMALRNRVPLLVSNRLGFRRVYPAVPEFSAGALSLLQDRDGTFLMRSRGGSLIIDECGRIVAHPKQNIPHDVGAMSGAPFGPQPIAHFQEEETLTASFRVDDIRVQRLTSPFIAERREDLYGAPISPAEKAPATPAVKPVESANKPAANAEKKEKAKPKRARKPKKEAGA